MNVPLSPRLLACCDLVHPGDRVADIGCDHGYLGIYLLQKGIAASVIAADVNRQPLDSALLNGHRYHTEDRMRFYLSAGFANVPHDFDVAVCAGMGADTIVSILAAAPWLKSGAYRLILQCQSKIPTLRQFLSENGWYIRQEQVLRDGKFLYTIMEVLWDPGQPRLTPAQCYFPPALRQCPGKALGDYYRWVVQGLRIATQHRELPDLEPILAELETISHEFEEETL